MVSAHLDEVIADKIGKGEYIDFSKLLPKDRVAAVEEEGRFEMIIKNGKSFWVPVNQGVNISNFSKWEQAFRVYSNIYCKRNPERAAELIEYNHVIHTIASTYTWENVYNYDKEFRLHMARNPQRSWSIILQQAWSLRLRDQGYSGFHNNNGNHGNNQSRNCSNGNEPCRRFNRGKCNFGVNCRYEHRCSYCFKFGHGAVHCRKAIADRGSSGGQQNRDRGNGDGQSPSQFKPGAEKGANPDKSFVKAGPV